MGRSPFMILPFLRLRAATDRSRAESRAACADWDAERAEEIHRCCQDASARRVDEIGLEIYDRSFTGLQRRLRRTEVTRAAFPRPLRLPPGHPSKAAPSEPKRSPRHPQPARSLAQNASKSSELA
jgi:hypothetical protein